MKQNFASGFCLLDLQKQKYGCGEEKAVNDECVEAVIWKVFYQEFDRKNAWYKCSDEAG